MQDDFVINFKFHAMLDQMTFRSIINICLYNSHIFIRNIFFRRINILDFLFHYIYFFFTFKEQENRIQLLKDNNFDVTVLHTKMTL